MIKRNCLLIIALLFLLSKRLLPPRKTREASKTLEVCADTPATYDISLPPRTDSDIGGKVAILLEDKALTAPCELDVASQ